MSRPPLRRPLLTSQKSIRLASILPRHTVLRDRPDDGQQKSRKRRRRQFNIRVRIIHARNIQPQRTRPRNPLASRQRHMAASGRQHRSVCVCRPDAARSDSRVSNEHGRTTRVAAVLHLRLPPMPMGIRQLVRIARRGGQLPAFQYPAGEYMVSLRPMYNESD